MNCKVCGKPVASGPVVHSECLPGVQTAQKLDNKPLTADELRTMVGEPIWHVELRPDGGKQHWEILRNMIARFPEDSQYGKRWIAYRYKPREWVSVKDRRPEYDSPVWGWDTQDHCAKEVNYIDGEFFDTLGEDANITHWMPLPEPPEVE